jgi:anti-sigma factor RsiW
MRGCSRWTDAITDSALGNAPEPELAAHLAICPECQDALRESRAMAARIDEALHRDAAVDPPVEGPERVMARIHDRADTRGWWRWAAMGGAMAALGIGTVLWVGRPAPEADVSALSTWRSPTQELLHPPVAAAWTTTPRLGEGFFKLKPTGGTNAQ